MRKELSRLIELDREAGLLVHIDALLGWDQETYMPPGAVEERSEQIALVQALAHERAVSSEIGDLLAALGSTAETPLGEPSLDGRERAYLRVLRRAYDRETKLPASLVSELARATSLSQAAWVEARRSDAFAAFAPWLERIVELKRNQAACLSAGSPNSGASAYDALLDLFEPGCTEAFLSSLFAGLRRDLVELLGRVRSRPQVDGSFLRRPCPVSRQAAISEWLMDEMTYDRSRGRLDTTAHPFTTTLGSGDVRITTRYLEDDFTSSLFSTVHETGHALYEQGIAPGPSFARTRLHDAASMAIHESQSRLWENVVARSRAFWASRYGRLAELAGSALEGIGLDAFARAVNRVEPSLIRTEADEVTYCLHVILRFELESRLIRGDLAVRDLPEAWSAGMKELLGVAPSSDAEGCLQDVHWSAGLFGYFPSYALGNLYAAQLWSAMRASIPDLEERIAAGELGDLLVWLRKNVHEPGATYLPGELIERASGAKLAASHFTAYLSEKYSRVYGL
jgi:carboxypeptidase Taq